MGIISWNPTVTGFDFPSNTLITAGPGSTFYSNPPTLAEVQSGSGVNQIIAEINRRAWQTDAVAVRDKSEGNYVFTALPYITIANRYKELYDMNLYYYVYKLRQWERIDSYGSIPSNPNTPNPIDLDLYLKNLRLLLDSNYKWAVRLSRLYTEDSYFYPNVPFMYARALYYSTSDYLNRINAYVQWATQSSSVSAQVAFNSSTDIQVTRAYLCFNLPSGKSGVGRILFDHRGHSARGRFGFYSTTAGFPPTPNDMNLKDTLLWDQMWSDYGAVGWKESGNLGSISSGQRRFNWECQADDIRGQWTEWCSIGIPRGVSGSGFESIILRLY